MTKQYVKLPVRSTTGGAESIDPSTGFYRTLESHSEDFKVTLLGKVIVPSGRTVTLYPDPHAAKRGAKSRTVQDTDMLLVFQDHISKKVFYWAGTRAQSENVRLNNHYSVEKEITYSNWPNELIHVTDRNLKVFYAYIYGFGVEYVLEEDDFNKVKKQKTRLVETLKEMAGS